MKTARAVGLAVFVLACGCAQPQPPKRYRITVEVYADLNPLAGAQISLRNVAAGTTDATGVAQFTLPGREGQVVPLTVRCPDHTRSPATALDVSLRTLNTLDPVLAARGIVQKVNCPPVDRTLAVIVRTDRRVGLPVQWQSVPITRTDDGAVAHVTFRARPNTTLALTLDTSGAPTLRPQNPTRQFVVPDRDDVMVWDQAFDEEIVRRPRGHVVRNRGPQRIPSGTRW